MELIDVLARLPLQQELQYVEILDPLLVVNLLEKIINPMHWANFL